MSQRQARSRANHSVITGVEWGEAQPDVSQIGIKTAIVRASRLCACGCGTSFVPTCNTHKYIKGHSQALYIQKKKDALMMFVEGLLLEHGASAKTAARRGCEAGELYLNAWSKCLARCGYRYNSKTCEWVKC